MRATGLRSCPASRDDADRRRLARLLVKGPVGADAATDVWTLPRVRELVEHEFGVGLSKSQIWRFFEAWGYR
jgi:transposase